MTEFTALTLAGSVFLVGIGCYLCLLAGKQRKLQTAVRNLEQYLAKK